MAGGKKGTRGPVDPKKRRTVLMAYRRNVPIADIMERYDVSKSTLYSWVNGKTRGAGNRKRRKYTQDVLDQIATLNYRGWSDRKIAKRLGLEHKWVGVERKAMGLPSFKEMQER